MEQVGRLFITGQTEAIVCRWELVGTYLQLQERAFEGRSWTMQPQRARLSLGGFNEDQIVLQEDALTFYASRPELEKPLRALGLLNVQQALGRESRRVRHNVRMSYVWAGLLFMLLALSGLLGWWVSDRMVEAAAAMTPVSWDVELGRASYRALGFGTREIHDPRLVRPLQDLADQLTRPYQGQGLAFEVHLVKDPQVNAFALPGGQIIICTGLLESAQGGDELVGVLAHEVQHVVGRHGVRAIYSQLRWQLALTVLVGDSSQLHAQLLSSATFLAGLSYSRDSESEADRQGIALLAQLQWPQQGLVKFFQRLDRQQGEMERHLKYLSTHPASAERKAALEKMLSPQPTERSVPLDWSAIRSALGRGNQDVSPGRQ
ncbi:MAG: M48 family metallopeptidase [Vulcanimicrobiota bacterium]